MAGARGYRIASICAFFAGAHRAAFISAFLWSRRLTFTALLAASVAVTAATVWRHLNALNLMNRYTRVVTTPNLAVSY